ncbi:MAG TPA: 2Fe-2S iron-sulfur cluster-binding protein [Stellaceae bacterium]|nr:2Fe-2S iron-sulfur cluster-binding protein [Stellaceae bacterium]
MCLRQSRCGSLVELLRTDTEQTEASVREAISGNLCRCTGYQEIVDAALDAAKIMTKQKEANRA